MRVPKRKGEVAPGATETDVLRDCWFAGRLWFLLRRGAQMQVYEWLSNSLEEHPATILPFVLRAHRRLGKSITGLTLLIERCLARPGQRCLYGAPTEKQVSGIVLPNLEILRRTMPEQLAPRPRGNTWLFYNPAWPSGSIPSKLVLAGVDYRKGDLLRGPFADATFLDEVREMQHTRYLVEDVLLYQFVGRMWPWLLLASTPPKSSDHDFESYFAPRAMADRRYLEIPVTKNPDWTERDERMLLSAIGGGKESTSWRREALCERISDEEELIVPEFLKFEDQVVVLGRKRPEKYRPITCCDTGWTDWNALLYGYVDFEHQALVIEDESIMRYQSTGAIVEEAVRKERKLWGEQKPIRFGDLTDQALVDLRKDHKFFIRKAQKWDRESAIARLRTGVANGRLVIFERCENLRYQLRTGTWNERRTQFERSERLGHCDALAALIYMYRHAPWGGNPFAQDDRVIDDPEMFISPTQKRAKPATAKALLSALGRP